MNSPVDTKAAGGGTGVMQPLIVRAELAAGVAQGAPWAPALDGILASRRWATEKETEIADGRYQVRALTQDYPPDLELPLVRCPLVEGPQWHWLSTCGWPEGPAGDTSVHTWTGRVDARELEEVADVLPKVVSRRQGRYRSRCMPLLVATCRALTWRAVGDPAAIAQLLDGVISIGKKRSSGEGKVVQWSVTPVAGLDVIIAGHLHPDGSLGRPTPAPCHAHLPDGESGGYGTAGVRPPYMHRSRQHQVHLPALLDAS